MGSVVVMIVIGERSVICGDNNMCLELQYRSQGVSGRMWVEVPESVWVDVNGWHCIYDVMKV